MKIGFIIPIFPYEKRVALLPEDVAIRNNEIVIEKGFGNILDIDDSAYQEKCCQVESKE